MSALSRRGILGSVATLVPVAGAGAACLPLAPAAGPDAELIATCRAMMAAQQAYDAIYDGPDAIEDDALAKGAAAPIVARWNVLLDELERLHATTTAGVAARAQCLALHADHGAFSFDWPGSMTRRLLDYLLRDATGLPGEVVA